MVHAYTENANINCYISGDLAVHMSLSVHIEMPDFRHTDIVKVMTFFSFEKNKKQNNLFYWKCNSIFISLVSRDCTAIKNV